MRAVDTPELRTERLFLVPLRVEDATEMVQVLNHRDLYEFTGGDPPSHQELESRYANQVKGPASTDEVWHNWILRLKGSHRAIGFVQATMTSDTADVAWVVGKDWQDHGFATEAASELCQFLREAGTGRITAHIHPNHVASQRIAESAGLVRTAEIDADGEIVWKRSFE